MWIIGVEVGQETSAPPPKKNPGSAPEVKVTACECDSELEIISVVLNSIYSMFLFRQDSQAPSSIFGSSGVDLQAEFILFA